MDTHAAVRMLTAAGAEEALAVAVVDVAQNAAADHGRELATRSDLDHLAALEGLAAVGPSHVIPHGSNLMPRGWAIRR